MAAVGISGCNSGQSDADRSDTTTPTESAIRSEPRSEPSSTHAQVETEEQPKWAKTFNVYATNQTGNKQTVDVTIERDGDQLVDESYTLGGNRGENTSGEIGEYEQAGSYTIAVKSESLGSKNRETLDVRQRYLDDCNATSGRIDLWEDGRIQIRLFRTSKDCQSE